MKTENNFGNQLHSMTIIEPGSATVGNTKHVFEPMLRLY